jgi:hypothetical protein
MTRGSRAGLVGLLSAGCLLLIGSAAKAQPPEDKRGEKTNKAAQMEQCSRSCSACMRACEICALHSAQLVADGKKEHLRSLGLCLDCSEFCALASRVVAHHGVLSRLACEACAKACDACGTECGKYSDDRQFQQCAQACRDCARACREMFQGGRPKETPKGEKGG